ncbi:hypothetical protein [Micromonospora sp. CPCC 206061]|uniref:hypothetical protein n=1 Tax=Micromonospora sp. CPCC 206061 TaxID=3122410 RepID=UPI002FF38838
MLRRSFIARPVGGALLSGNIGSVASAADVGTLDPYVRQVAETIAWAVGVKTEPSREGGMNVAQLSNGGFQGDVTVADGAPSTPSITFTSP